MPAVSTCLLPSTSLLEFYDSRQPWKFARVSVEDFLRLFRDVLKRHTNFLIAPRTIVPPSDNVILTRARCLFDVTFSCTIEDSRISIVKHYIFTYCDDLSDSVHTLYDVVLIPHSPLPWAGFGRLGDFMIPQKHVNMSLHFFESS